VRLKVCAWAGARVCEGEDLGVSKGRERLGPEERTQIPGTLLRWAPGSGFGQSPSSSAVAPWLGQGGRAGTPDLGGASGYCSALKDASFDARSVL